MLKSTTTVADAKAVYRKLLGGQLILMISFVSTQRRSVLPAVLPGKDAGDRCVVRLPGMRRLPQGTWPRRHGHGSFDTSSRFRSTDGRADRKLHAERGHEVHPALRPHKG